MCVCAKNHSPPGRVNSERESSPSPPTASAGPSERGCERAPRGGEKVSRASSFLQAEARPGPENESRELSWLMAAELKNNPECIWVGGEGAETTGVGKAAASPADGLMWR